MLHPSELSYILLSYAQTLPSFPTPYWATLHPPELPQPPATLQSYATTYLTTLHLLINAAPNIAMPYGLAHPNWAIELRLKYWLKFSDLQK